MENYTKDLIELLSNNRNAEEAVPMKQYMRNQFEFLGIRRPKREELLKAWLKRNGLLSKEQLPDVLTSLWNMPEREYQYTALELLEKMKKKLDKDHIDLLEWLILHKSWWDTVDGIAPNAVGYLFQNHPELIGSYAEQWIESDNMWLQRSAILYQLKYKSKTNERLLFDYVLRRAESEQFFIQKAIGWALREYSKTNPQAVKQFIEGHELKPLSRREGLKQLDKQERIQSNESEE
ncbi:DNA alkylation repair protein [Paenibacillus sp. UNC451MF]|uniref:DNA alkylation repair protein n=1 Tax=Paenibacillus sp. UNC451MF TaxID=1449063 RepID=UPI00048D6C6A|nr:DNA alkylation repair protein [Paenibacillus sp. UNC451MF]